MGVPSYAVWIEKRAQLPHSANCRCITGSAGQWGNGIPRRYHRGGKTLQERLSLLEAVLERLKRAGLTVKSKKVIACRRRLRFLGRLVGEGVEPDPEKVAVITDWPRPSSTKEVRSFLGLCALGCIKGQFFLVAIYLAAQNVRIGTVDKHVKYFANQ